MICLAAFAGDHNKIDSRLSQPIPIAQWRAARTESREGTGETTNTKTH
jgi:hypothetical protein